MVIQEFLVQIRELTYASIKSRYRKTWAGFLWVLLNPILMFGVQSLVFKKFLKLEMPDYFLFLLGGLLPWIFFTSTVQMGTPVFVIQSQLLRSFKINPWVILGSQVLDSFINFTASFILIMIPFYFISNKPFLSLLLLPIALIPLLIGTLSITVICSVLNVFYRDINFVMSFVFSLLFFLTPIFYPVDFVPIDYRWMVELNPIIYFIDPFRSIIHTTNFDGFAFLLFKSYAVATLFTLLALFIWNRKQNDFYRRL
jgi:ABC-type polysaccharide/polyol phosphate export permease